jgi:hypothetical protein
VSVSKSSRCKNSSSLWWTDLKLLLLLLLPLQRFPAELLLHAIQEQLTRTLGNGVFPFVFRNLCLLMHPQLCRRKRSLQNFRHSKKATLPNSSFRKKARLNRFSTLSKLLHTNKLFESIIFFIHQKRHRQQQ